MARANEGLEEAFHADPRLDVGGQTEIRFAVDRKRTCEIISTSRAIVDKAGLEHVVNGYTRTNSTRPGREVYDGMISIPETVPPGKAWYYIRLRYGCNVLNFRGVAYRGRKPACAAPGLAEGGQGLGLPAKVETDPASYDA